MAITNTWSVVQMDAYPEVDGETDVVFNVHWSLVATDGKYTGSVYSSQALNLDPSAPFTPYADLTEAQVLGWVFAAMGKEEVEALEANVAEQIGDQIDPPVVTPPLPWAPPVEA